MGRNPHSLHTTHAAAAQCLGVGGAPYRRMRRITSFSPVNASVGTDQRHRSLAIGHRTTLSSAQLFVTLLGRRALSLSLSCLRPMLCANAPASVTQATPGCVNRSVLSRPHRGHCSLDARARARARARTHTHTHTHTHYTHRRTQTHLTTNPDGGLARRTRSHHGNYRPAIPHSRSSPLAQ